MSHNLCGGLGGVSGAEGSDVAEAMPYAPLGKNAREVGGPPYMQPITLAGHRRRALCRGMLESILERPLMTLEDAFIDRKNPQMPSEVVRFEVV